MLNPAIPSVPNLNNPNCPGNLIQWRGKGKKFNWRQWADAALEGFLSWGRNSRPDCFGSCLWSPEGFVNHVNSGADEGMRAPFRQAAVRAPLIIWSGPDCRGVGGARGGVLHQTGLGSGPVPTNGIIKTAAYLWAKNRFTSVVHFVLGIPYFSFFQRQAACCLGPLVFRPACISDHFIRWLVIRVWMWTKPLFHTNRTTTAKMSRHNSVNQMSQSFYSTFSRNTWPFSCKFRMSYPKWAFCIKSQVLVWKCRKPKWSADRYKEKEERRSKKRSMKIDHVFQCDCDIHWPTSDIESNKLNM